MNNKDQNMRNETNENLRIIIVQNEAVREWNENERVILYMKEDELSILIKQLKEVIPKLHRSRRKNITKLLLREVIKLERKDRLDERRVGEMIREWRDKVKTEKDLEDGQDPTKINITIDGKVVWT